ncbi:MAG: serine/threonine protein kinase, partial [Actinomycetota bacterium]|nr:serine/threonine protein kinase [Actinomycetota bacterium]
MAGHPGAVPRVDDRYELREHIGRGGFGVVWRAHDTLLQRGVAVKEIRFPGVLNESERAQACERVLREARAAARLNHPGAVTVYDVVEDNGQTYIVMELVEAPNLSELVERHGPLSPARMAAVALELLDTLSAAHALRIVHRDVKPANVMVSESGRVRLADFGIAAILDDPKVTTSGDITGSPSYMAPEQVNNQPTGPATDLWSLGATMYFGVEGEPPFSKGAVIPTLTSIASDAPRPAQRAGALGPVLDALLVKDPAGRLDPGTLRRRLTEVATASAPPPAPLAPRPDDTVLLDVAPTQARTAPEATAVAPPPSPPPPPPP